MSENQSDFIKDQDVIKQEMNNMVEHLRRIKGFNIGSNNFEVDKDANGYVIRLRSVVDNVKDLPNGWTYGTYYLDGYPKTGMFAMKNGKYIFLPTRNEIDKSTEVEYKTVNDFRSAIIAANPHLDQKVSITTGLGAEGVIQIEGSLHGIDLPTTDLFYDADKGCIVSSINPSIEFRVEFVRSAEVNHETNVYGDASSDVNSSLDQAAIRDEESIATRGESEGKGVSISEYGVQIMDFGLMKYVAENYTFGDDNNVISKIDDETRYRLNEGRSVSSDSDPRRIEAVLKLNKIWANSYQQALLGSGREVDDDLAAFQGEATTSNFNVVIQGLVNSGTQLKMSQIPELLYEKFGFEQGGFVKVMLFFISNPEISHMFQFEMDITPEMAVQKIDEIKNTALKEEAADVMERVFKPNSNNGTIN